MRGGAWSACDAEDNTSDTSLRLCRLTMPGASLAACLLEVSGRGTVALRRINILYVTQYSFRPENRRLLGSKRAPPTAKLAGTAGGLPPTTFSSMFCCRRGLLRFPKSTIAVPYALLRNLKYAIARVHIWTSSVRRGGALASLRYRMRMTSNAMTRSTFACAI